MFESRRFAAFVVLSFSVAFGVAFGARSAAPSVVLFESDGSSLSPFPCHYLSWAPAPVIDESDGIPPPSIRYTTYSPASYSLSLPYAVNGLPVGSRLHGSMDVSILGVTNNVALAAFGVSTRNACDYHPYAGPWDGRYPVPDITYYSSDELLSIWTTDASGQVVNTQSPCTISLGGWHHVDFSLAAAADGACDWELLVDSRPIAQGRSYEPILADDSLGVTVGAYGSFAATDLKYDNIKVEILPACQFGPDGQPFVVTRLAGAPRVETLAWESCGGPGTITVRCEHASSAWVHLNGVTVLTPSDFRPNQATIEVAVELLEGDNRLDVELHGKPGSSLSFELASSP